MRGEEERANERSNTRQQVSQSSDSDDVTQTVKPSATLRPSTKLTLSLCAMP